MKGIPKVLLQILKKIRAFIPLNILVRSLIKLQTNFNSRVFRIFSVHWPVSGSIKFQLPAGESGRIYSKDDDYIATQVFWKGYAGYEGPSIEAFYRLSKKSSVIIDIGANTGYFTLISALSNSNARVHSFEPVNRIYERLNLNIKINNLLNVTTVNSIVGDSDKPVKFYVPKGSGMVMAGSTKKEWAKLHDKYGDNNTILSGPDSKSESQEIEVPSTTLDLYKSNKGISKIYLVKMDCECHEIEVLNGMTRVLKEDKPVILMEVIFESEWLEGNSKLVTHLEIERILKSSGYFFYLIVGDALLRLDKLEQNPNERNYIFSTICTEKTYLPFSEITSLLS
jgi:FkbM family methyltransferase